jgi:DNA-binding SARP family transcriptional activator
VIRCRVLGPLEVSIEGAAAPPELLWRKHIALLVYLARSPRGTRSRDHLVALLWGERPEAAARHSLREALRVLRRTLGESVVGGAGDQVRLDVAQVALDADEFEAAAAAGDWAQASALAAGEFLEGYTLPDAPPFEDWLAAERLGLRSRMVDALTRHAEQRLAAGDLAGAQDAALRALGLEPAAEAAARAVMAARALAGDRAGALAAFDQVAARMGDLGLEPAPATTALAERIRRRRPAPVPAPAAADAAPRRAPLVGRDRELAHALDVWRAVRTAPHAGIVIIDGETGYGRSRLLEELAARTALEGAALAAVRGVPADQRAPFNGCVGLAGGGLLEAAGVAGAPREALAAFARRLEAWADRFPGASNAAPLPPAEALGAVVRAASVEQPVVLALDDAHHLDPQSLLALDALARDLARAPVLLLLTATLHPPREEIEALRARIGRDVAGALLRLEPLGPEALRALVRWALPAYGAVEADRLARRLGADSAGTPLLAVELLHAVALGLDLHPLPHAWPEPQRTLDQTLPGELPQSVTAAIRVGYRRLGKDAQAAVAAVAALEEPVEPARLARALNWDRARLDAALDDAEWQRWLSADGRGYTFLARIVRDVIAADMITPGQRLRIREAAGA